MEIQTLQIGGKEYVVIERGEFDRMLQSSGGRLPELPELPKADAKGNVPAIEYSRISLARKIILARHEAGLSQAELARRAGIRVETLNRLEKGRHSADEATVEKIEKALGEARPARDSATERLMRELVEEGLRRAEATSPPMVFSPGRRSPRTSRSSK